MKNLLVLSALILLSGCANIIGVKPHWPDLPPNLEESCPDLKQIETSTTKLSKVLDVVVDNYSSYHECQNKSKAWLEWYRIQKKNYEEIK